jgi:hypothetical protein
MSRLSEVFTAHSISETEFTGFAVGLFERLSRPLARCGWFSEGLVGGGSRLRVMLRDEGPH